MQQKKTTHEALFKRRRESLARAASESSRNEFRRKHRNRMSQANSKEKKSFHKKKYTYLSPLNEKI